MTQPKRAIATDQGRYYTHPVTGELLISVTNVLSEAMAKPALVPWAAKASNDAAWSALPRMVAAMLRPLDCKPTSRELSQIRAEGDDWTPCGRCMPCLTREIKGAHKLIAERASDLGTRIHAHADAHITGASLPHDEEVETYLGQYLRFLDDFGVDIERDVFAAELSVADPGAGYAGTLDLLIYLPIEGHLTGEPIRPAKGGERSLYLVDLKTSATKPVDVVYDEYALQLTALRAAKEMWMPDDTVRRMVPVKGCAVLNLRTHDYALIPLPALLPERRAWSGALSVAKWRHGKPVADARPIAPNGASIPKSTARRGAKKAAPAAIRKAS